MEVVVTTALVVLALLVDKQLNHNNQATLELMDLVTLEAQWAPATLVEAVAVVPTQMVVLPLQIQVVLVVLVNNTISLVHRYTMLEAAVVPVVLVVSLLDHQAETAVVEVEVSLLALPQTTDYNNQHDTVDELDEVHLYLHLYPENLLEAVAVLVSSL